MLGNRQRMALVDDLIKRRNELDDILSQNGLYHITTPTWLWPAGSKIFWARGYGSGTEGQSTMAAIVASVKASA